MSAMKPTTAMHVLIGVERCSRAHQWARLYMAGKTISVDLSRIEFCPCTSKPRRIEVAIEEIVKPCGESTYTETSATIYATSSEIAALCVSLGIGTVKNPVVPDVERKD